jgi:Protein of unknown function (DUF5818)
MLRRITFVLLLMIAIAPAMFAGEWVGWITDEHCGEKGTSGTHGSCALRCAERGAALVLYNAEDKKAYKLDDQEKAKALAGKKVKVVGTMEEATIKIESIDEVKAE